MKVKKCFHTEHVFVLPPNPPTPFVSSVKKRVIDETWHASFYAGLTGIGEPTHSVTLNYSTPMFASLLARETSGCEAAGSWNWLTS